MPYPILIFVFGSNESGIHGAGAAYHARKFYGAVWGVPEGRTGDAYAIPTVGPEIKYTLELDDIKPYVDRFLAYARAHPELHFQVTEIGCGLAGYEHEEIAPMFKGAPNNCSFSRNWLPFLEEPKPKPLERTSKDNLRRG